MGRTLHVHFVVASLFTAAVIVLSRVFSLGLSTQICLAVAGVSLVGLPHGACDYLAGRKLFADDFGHAWFVPFSLIYLGLGAGVLVVWQWDPLVALLAFLVVALFHFGRGDFDVVRAPFRGTPFARLGVVLEAFARGAIPVTIPALAHPTATASLFDALVGGSTASFIEAARIPFATALTLSLGIVLAHHAKSALRGDRAHNRDAVQIPLLFMLFSVVPPLLAFVVYFCFWHSFRHSLRLAASLDAASPRAALLAFARRAAPMTVAALLLGAVGYLVMRPVVPAGDALLRVLFIGLSVLTVPHIVFSNLEERLGADLRPRRAVSAWVRGASMVLCLSVPALALAASPTKSAEQLVGTYRYAGGEAGIEQIERRIDVAVEDMNVFIRGIARRRLRDANLPTDGLSVSLEEGQLTIGRTGKPSVTAPVDGTTVRWENPDNGNELDVQYRFEDDGTVVQELEGDRGTSRNRYVLSEDGNQLTVHGVVRADKLPEPLRFQVRYERRTQRASKR